MKAPTNRTHPQMTTATEPLRFIVDAENHVKGSVVGDEENCAAACSLKSYSNIIAAWVKRSVTIIEFDNGRVLKWRNPSRLQEAVEEFDTTAGYFPAGEYILQPVPKSWSAEAQRKRGRGENNGSNPKGSRSRPAHVIR